MSGETGSAMVDHELKCWPIYFDSIVTRTKSFELRRDDRGGFLPGQRLRLREWDPKIEAYTGRCIEVTIGFVVQQHDGLVPGFVCMTIKGPAQERADHRIAELERELVATGEEHARLADAASAYIETVDPDFVGNMPVWFREHTRKLDAARAANEEGK